MSKNNFSLMERVPQYIDVEDHIAGPLTWRQLGWFFGAGGILFLLWNVLERGAFWIASVPIVLLTTAFAFYKPHGVSLINFIGYAFSFAMKPKMYIWQREGLPQKEKPKKSTQPTTQHKKTPSVEDITAITKTLDSHGQERSKRIEALIKKNTQT